MSDPDGGQSEPTELPTTTEAPAITDGPRGRLHATAVLLASLVVPLPVVTGRVVEGVLDTLNPAQTDVTAALAYLSEILLTSFGALCVLLIAIVAVFVRLARRSGFRALRLPLLILGVELAFGAIGLASNALIQAAEG